MLTNYCKFCKQDIDTKDLWIHMAQKHPNSDADNVFEKPIKEKKNEPSGQQDK